LTKSKLLTLIRGGGREADGGDEEESEKERRKNTIPSALRAPPLAKWRSSAEAEHYSKKILIDIQMEQ